MDAIRETIRSFSLRRFKDFWRESLKIVVWLVGFYFILDQVFSLSAAKQWLQEPIGQSLWGEELLSTRISMFIVVFTGLIALAILASWIKGGRKACLHVTLMLNLEIILYTVYSEKPGYFIELTNFLLFPILSFFESPHDKKEREAQEQLKLSIEKETQVEKEKIEFETELNQLEMFKGMYNKMFHDFEKKAIVDTKQDLQRMEFSWQTMVENALKDKLHKNKNEWKLVGLEGIEKHIYDIILVPFQEQILGSLKRLPEVMDIKLSDHSLGEICEALEKSKPKTFEKDRNLKYAFRNEIAENDLQSGKCAVNLSRLVSIAFNLLANSNQAGSRKQDAMLETGQDYCKSIELAIERIESKGQGVLSIQVRDNCGGIEDGKLADIYKKPIISSCHDTRTGGERNGEGTVYIGFFVNYMGGEINVRNYESDDGYIGAETKILLPIKYD